MRHRPALCLASSFPALAFAYAAHAQTAPAPVLRLPARPVFTPLPQPVRRPDAAPPAAPVRPPLAPRAIAQAGQPDLVVTGTRLDNGQVLVDVANNGVVASSAVTVSLLVKGGIALSQPLSALAPHATATIRFAVPSAAATVQATVDPDNQVAESNESNNRGPVLSLALASPMQVTRAPLRTVSPPNHGAAPIAPLPLRPVSTASPVATPSAMGDEEAALIGRIGQPHVAASPIAAGLVRTKPQLLLDGQRAPLDVICTAGKAGQDAVTLSRSNDGLLTVHFVCYPSSMGGHPADYTVTVRTGGKGALVPGRGPRRITVGGALLPTTQSRTFAEIANCVDLFGKYKGGGYIFHIGATGNYPRCSLVAASTFDKQLLAMVPAKAVLGPNGRPTKIDRGAIDAALIDNSRPEHLIHWTPPHHGSGGEVDQSQPAHAEALTGEVLTPAGPPPVSGPPSTLTTAPMSNGTRWSAAFLSRTKPAYSIAVLQLVKRSGPNVLAGKSVTLNGVTTQVPAASNKVTDFASAAAKGNPCIAALAPDKLAGLTVVKLDAPVKLETPIDAGWAAPGPAWVSTFALNETQYKQLLGGQKDGNYWLRVIPAVSQGSAAPVPGCAGEPSDPSPVSVGYTAAELATYQTLQQGQVQAEVDAALAAAQQALPGGPAGAAPLTVEVIGWVPPDHSWGTLVMNAVPHDEMVMKNGLPVSLSLVDPDAFLAKPHEDTFSLDDAYPTATWPWRKGWFKGGIYDTIQFEEAEKAKEAIDDWYDYLLAGLNIMTAPYQMLQQVIVEAVVYAASGGECPFNAPGETAQNQAKACSVFKDVASTGLKVAMSAAGLPPTLPNAGELIDQGADYLAGLALDYVDAGALSDIARQELAKATANAIRQAVHYHECATPIDPNKPAKDQGYDSIDLKNSCGYRAGDWTTFAHWDHLPSTDYTAVMFVRVKRNPNALPGVDPHMELSAYVEQTANPTDPKYDGLKKDIAKLGYSPQPLIGPDPIRIDARNVPPEGTVIPIVFFYPAALYKWAVSDHMSCQSQLLGDCLGAAFNVWEAMLQGGQQKMTLNAAYRFGPDITLSEPSKTGGHNLVASAPAIAHFSPAQLSGSLGKVVPGLTFGIPTYLPEPGFKLTGETSLRGTGLPTYRVVPKDDLSDHY